MSDMSAEFGERIRAASNDKPLWIRGAGSKDFYGNAPRGESPDVLDVLDVRGHAGIVAYEPTELFITAKCGTPLAEIEAVLAERGQYLPFEPPRFGPGSTLGGAVAAGLSGPRRASGGALRDFMLGVKILDGEARELAFGGQMIKNVAGYDVSRLIAGSLGTQGLILEVSLKVLPQSAAESTLRFGMTQAEALDQLNRWAGQPLPIVASIWLEGVLTLRLAGARAAVGAAEQKLGGEKVGAGGTAFWDDVRDQRAPYFAGDVPLWRLSLPTVTPAIDLPGATLIEWGGALRWLRSEAPVPTIRAAAEKVGGSATAYRCAAALKSAGGAFAPLPEPLMNLQRRVKQAFDPRGIFNPGRMYPDL